MRERNVAHLSRLLWIGLVALAACNGPATSDTTGRIQAPIVNGQNESGWPGVGALTINYPGWGYQGSFCTGTLVAPQWVLTAGHCVSSEGEMPIDAENVMFYVGTNANPGGNGWPSSGSLYQADALYPYPGYDAVEMTNDIGLVHLAEPVPDAVVYDINLATLTRAFVGRDVLYVGFGVSDGAAGSGGGIKRSTSLPLYGYEDTYYITEYENSNVCFGDSGGPGLLEVDGVWKIVGVVSGGTSDTCIGGWDFSTRVDAFGTWVLDMVGGTPPTCQELPEMCACPEACLPDGVCNDALCRDYTCADIYDCIYGCGEGDTACQTACHDRGTDEGRTVVDALFTCFEEKCATAADFQGCVSEQCDDEVDACFPRQTGSLTCEEAYDCVGGCPDGDHECFGGCFAQGTDDAQDQLSAMFRCFRQQCGDAETAEEYSACASEKCSEQIYACIPPVDCEVAGGDCAAGEVCLFVGAGRSDCFPSGGGVYGAPCDAAATDPFPCGDGLVCWGPDDGEAVCRKLCFEAAHCREGETCERGILQGSGDPGICFGGPVCLDADRDGACAADDCDDTSPSVQADGDGDGVCLPADCDDADANVSADVDGDGVCADEDCNDTNSGIYPGAEEVCDNGRDDDCDQETDEGCVVPPATDVVGPKPEADVVSGEGDTTAPGTDVAVDPGFDDDDDDATGGTSTGCTAAPTGQRGALPLLFVFAILAFVLRRRSA